MKKVVYIAGKMTGLPDKGRAKFAAAERDLRKMGYIPLNPAKLPDHLPRDRYMPICLAMLAQADAIAMLDNWQQSPGARLELRYARYQGKEILFNH